MNIIFLGLGMLISLSMFILGISFIFLSELTLAYPLIMAGSIQFIYFTIISGEVV